MSDVLIILAVAVLGLVLLVWAMNKSSRDGSGMIKNPHIEKIRELQTALAAANDRIDELQDQLRPIDDVRKERDQFMDAVRVLTKTCAAANARAEAAESELKKLRNQHDIPE